jgi:hypothetical protein
MLGAAPATSAGQMPSLSGYYQNVGVVSAATGGTGALALDAQRFRLMWTPTDGAWSFDVAYDHTVWWSERPSTTLAGGLLSSAQPAGDWLHLGGTVYNGSHLDWTQRFDRLDVSFTHDNVIATVGRQAISWATTLFLTPADPFVPFGPSDPFREYRTGVDAARLQWFPGAFSTVDFVVRPDDTPVGRTITALIRGKTTVSAWELSAWAGAIHDSPGAAVGITRTIAGSAVRAETEFRRDTSGHTIARSAIGIDRRFSVLSRDLYAVVEYQHDPFGAARPDELAATALSPPAEDHELQVLGRDESAMQFTYQVHPLVSTEFLALWNMRDGSVLVSPGAAVSLSDEVSARLGIFLSAGPRFDRALAPQSEYGPVPATGYASLSLFF